MRRGATLWMRLLVAGELLVIMSWIYLLFQCHPLAEANSLLVDTTPATDYRAVRIGIEQQLDQNYEAGEEDRIAGAFWFDSDLDMAFDRPPAQVPAAADQQAPLSPVPMATARMAISAGAQPEDASMPANETFNATAPGAAPVSPVPVRATSQLPASAPACPYRVSSIIRGATRSTVVLVNTMTGESLFRFTGEQLGEWRIVAINESNVELRAGEARRMLELE